MKLKFLGTRGSCAAPYTDRSEFGGNTSCVSVREGNCWLVLDAGTGVIPLANEIREAALQSGAEPCCVKILLSHFHLDHIVGLPMFLAALPKMAEVTLYTVSGGEETSGEKLMELIGPPLWPVKLTDVCSQLQFASLEEQTENDLGEGICVIPMRSNHPNNTFLYRIQWMGHTLVYGLDCEITDAFEEKYVRFAKGCDCLLFDGTYTDEDYPRCVGFGHSAFSKAAVIAKKTGTGGLYVMHYDYGYTDEMLRSAETTFANDQQIRFAREGQNIDL